MDLEKKIRRILKEETEDMLPLEQAVADFINMNLSEYDLPEGFYKVAVDIVYDNYGRQECLISMLFKKSFSMKDSDKLHIIMNEIKKEINGYFGDMFTYLGIGTSTVQVYNDTKDWINQKKNKKLNESDNKKKSLLNVIETTGLYHFIEMTNLSLSEVTEQVGELSRKTLEQFIIDFIDENGYNVSYDDSKRIMLTIPIKNVVWVDYISSNGDILWVEISEFENGNHREPTDVYTTSANNLEDIDILKIVETMIQENIRIRRMN